MVNVGKGPTWQFCDGDLFGMVSSRDPLERVVGDLQRLGIKMGHGLNHLEHVFFLNIELCWDWLY